MLPALSSHSIPPAPIPLAPIPYPQPSTPIPSALSSHAPMLPAPDSQLPAPRISITQNQGAVPWFLPKSLVRPAREGKNAPKRDQYRPKTEPAPPKTASSPPKSLINNNPSIDPSLTLYSILFSYGTWRDDFRTQRPSRPAIHTITLLTRNKTNFSQNKPFAKQTIPKITRRESA